LPTGYIYPAAERGLRDLGRRRLQLVKHRTMHVLAVENVQTRETESAPRPTPSLPRRHWRISSRRACYHMLKTGEPFDMKRCFG
jgi:hypothetical protein